MSPFVLILVFTLGAGSALAIDMPNNATCEGAAQFSKSQEKNNHAGKSRDGMWPAPERILDQVVANKSPLRRAGTLLGQPPTTQPVTRCLNGRPRLLGCRKSALSFMPSRSR